MNRAIMNRDAREILALFVTARRRFGVALTPIALAKELAIDAGQIRAAEKGQVISAAAAAKLGAWCGIELVKGVWR
jgi:hypothetical protein